MIRSLLREPLLHFLLLGAALFAAQAWLGAGPNSEPEREIVVSEARIRNLAENFRRVWQRPPTRAELEGLAEDYVREEIFYREALALGLDRDDTIVRRRLRQKMEFLSDEAATLAKPSERELAEYLAAHADEFQVEARATFAQVYLDPRRHADTLATDAARLLAELNRLGASADPANASDSLFLLEPHYENVAQREIARLFGAEFADALVKQPTGRWVGPVVSGYGAHLVRLESLTPARVASLDEVRPLVEREWANAKRREIGEAFYGRLRAKYRVTVRLPEAARPVGQPKAAGPREEPNVAPMPKERKS